MDLSEAKAILNKHNAVRWFGWSLQLQLWEINVLWGRLGDNETNTLGEVDLQPKYRRATITIDYERHGDEENLLRTLRHEMLHIVHADMELYRSQVSQCVGTDAFKTLDEAWSHGCEGIVRTLENAFDLGMGLTPLKHLRAAKKAAGQRR